MTLLESAIHISVINIGFYQRYIPTHNIFHTKKASRYDAHTAISQQKITFFHWKWTYKAHTTLRVQQHNLNSKLLIRSNFVIDSLPTDQATKTLKSTHDTLDAQLTAK